MSRNKALPPLPEMAHEIPSPPSGLEVPPPPMKKEMPMFPELPQERGEAAALIEEASEQEEIVEDTAPSIERMADIDISKPIFVGVNEFKTTLKEMNQLRARLKDASASIETISDIQNEKDKNLDDYRIALENIQEKLIYVDKSLFQG